MDAKKTGSLIADLRKQSNKTQKELANELHISSATVSKWERGIGFPDISLIEPLAKCLNISIIDLFNGEKTDSEESEKIERVLSDLIVASDQTITRNKKIMNWTVALTVAGLYLIISIITQEWAITWILWVAYCIYRILSDFIIK